LVGEIESINPEVIDVLTSNDYIPIISPIGVDERANTLNLNADTVAGDIAGHVGAEKLIILTDVPGILKDPNDPESLIKKVNLNGILELIDQGIVKDGMLPKVLTCINAIQMGVSSAHIIDGRIKHSVLLEIFTKKGIGTMITK
jgi:acetylglutamate kinase